MRRFIRRVAPVAAVTTVGALALAGCGSSGGGSNGGADAVTGQSFCKSTQTHAASGTTTSKKLTLTVLYRNVSNGSTKAFEVLQQELSQIGVTVKGLGVANADFYNKYMEVPSTAKAGAWDLAIAGWGPDWYGDGAASFFLPLFSGKPAFPPVGSNFGLYDNADANALINTANTATDPATAQANWGKADCKVMQDAAIYPITDPQEANYHSSNLHNTVVLPSLQNIDALNVTKTGANANTLYMLGVGDVDYMDPSITYYTSGYEAMRFFSRQLFNYSSTQGATNTTKAYPDLATEIPTQANGGISADGKTYTIHLTPGVKWNTSPARDVTASDVVLGVKRTCNPVQPFGAQPDFASLIEGYQTYCDKMSAAAGGANATVASLKSAIEKTALTGVTAPNPTTVVYHLTHPASYFVSMLAGLSGISAPVPVEYLNYLPASAQLAQHMISDGPYQIQSYTPTQSIVLVKNPVWQQSTDPIRKQNFDKVVINEAGNQSAIQQQIQSGSPTADMEWDTFPPATSVPGLKAANDPNLLITPESSSNPYVVFNTVSPNNGGALGNVAVRQALSEAISRAALIKVLGANLLNVPLSHVLPQEILGSVNFNLYGYNPSQAKADLAAALGK